MWYVVITKETIKVQKLNNYYIPHTTYNMITAYG